MQRLLHYTRYLTRQDSRRQVGSCVRGGMQRAPGAAWQWQWHHGRLRAEDKRARRASLRLSCLPFTQLLPALKQAEERRMRSMMDSQSGQRPFAGAHPTDATGAARARCCTAQLCCSAVARRPVGAKGCCWGSAASCNADLLPRRPGPLARAGQPPDFLRRGQPPPTYREREVEAEVASEAVVPGALRCVLRPTPQLSQHQAPSSAHPPSRSHCAPPTPNPEPAEDPWGLGPDDNTEAGMRRRLLEMMREGGCARPNEVLAAARRLFETGARAAGGREQTAEPSCSLRCVAGWTFAHPCAHECAAAAHCWCARGGLPGCPSPSRPAALRAPPQAWTRGAASAPQTSSPCAPAARAWWTPSAAAPCRRAPALPAGARAAALA